MNRFDTNIMTFDDIVFDNRNKNYGAYLIRQKYTNSILMGLLIGVFTFSIILSIPYISNLFKKTKEEKNILITKQVDVNLKKIEPEEEIKTYNKPEIPKIESIKFTIPIITTDDVVEMTTVEDIQASNPGEITNQGIEGFSDLPDNNGDEMIIGDTKTEEIFTVVEQMPEFPGGESAMYDFLDKNMQYPNIAKEQSIQGKVWIGFIVDKLGNVTNVEVLRGIGGGCDEEAIRVINMMPRWNPGKQSGKVVQVKFRFPINFSLK